MILLTISLLGWAWARFLLDCPLRLRFMILIRCDFCVNGGYKRGRRGKPSRKQSLLQRYLVKFCSNSHEFSMRTSWTCNYYNAKSTINQYLQYFKITEIGSLLTVDRPISLRCLAHRTLCVFLEPFEDTLLVVDMLAFQLYNFLIELELAVADSTEILFLFLDVFVRFVPDPLDFFHLLFGQALLLLIACCHNFNHSK